MKLSYEFNIVNHNPQRGSMQLDQAFADLISPWLWPAYRRLNTVMAIDGCHIGITSMTLKYMPEVAPAEVTQALYEAWIVYDEEAVAEFLAKYW
jgi:hypothetical protein